MLWREDTKQICVLYADGNWAIYADAWTPDKPGSDPEIVPPAERLQPVRGFGLVWRTQPGVRDKLGWALRAEEGQPAPVQEFERGAMIRIGNLTYVLVTSGGQPIGWFQRN
jgi:hypothetical protein